MQYSGWVPTSIRPGQCDIPNLLACVVDPPPPSRPDLRHHPWHQVETVFSMVWAFFYFIAACVVAGKGNSEYVIFLGDHGAFIAAACFGFMSAGCYTLQVRHESFLLLLSPAISYLLLDSPGVLLVAVVARPWEGRSRLRDGGASNTLRHG